MQNLTAHLKELEAEQQINSNTSRREVIKIRAEINNMESKTRNKTKKKHSRTDQIGRAHV